MILAIDEFDENIAMCVGEEWSGTICISSTEKKLKYGNAVRERTLVFMDADRRRQSIGG